MLVLENDGIKGDTWKEYLQNLHNGNKLKNTVGEKSNTDERDREGSIITEFKVALKELKNNKTPGVYKIHSESNKQNTKSKWTKTKCGSGVLLPLFAKIVDNCSSSRYSIHTPQEL